MNFFFQYQGKAEPLSPNAASDMNWKPTLGAIVRKAALPVAILAGALFFVPTISESITIDKWESRSIQIVRAQPRSRDYPCFSIAPSALIPTVTLDKWFSPVQQPRMDRKRWQRIYPFWATSYVLPASTVGLVCGSITVAPRISGSVTGSARIDGTPGLDPRIYGTPDLVEC